MQTNSLMAQVATVILLSIGLASCQTQAENSGQAEQPTQQVAAAKPQPTQQELVARGEYLLTTMGCSGCHSPKKMTDQGPVPDPDKLLSGHPADFPLAKFDKKHLNDWALFNMHSTAAVGPWGVSFAANLTPDETGIGNWTEEQFFTAMRQGKYKGLPNGRPLLPPMPWPDFVKATDDDLRALFAYLKSVKPVRNIVPAPIPPDQL